MMRRLLMAGTACATLVCAATPASAELRFNFQSTGNAQADAGFREAGRRWSSLFNDDITINIASRFSALPTGVIGSAQSETIGSPPSYTSVRNALVADARSAADSTAVANLPGGPSLSFYTNDRAGNRYLDNNANNNNNFLDVNRANGKALGLVPANDLGNDATITFSSTFPFDFDPSNGIDSDKIDFVATAAHEIGHAMGFVSGVDSVDYYSGRGPGANADFNGTAAGIGTLEDFAVFSPHDLFRYSSSSIATGGDVLELAFNQPAFHSTNGSTQMGPFSTGDSNGDGEQASHWKDNMALGLLDPTIGFGEVGRITDNDIRAFDVMGYNVVPEPSGLALVGVAAVAMLRRRRELNWMRAA